CVGQFTMSPYCPSINPHKRNLVELDLLKTKPHQSAYALPILVISFRRTTKPVSASNTTSPFSFLTNPYHNMKSIDSPTVAMIEAVPLVAMICSSLPIFSLKVSTSLSFFDQVMFVFQLKSPVDTGVAPNITSIPRF